MSRASFDPVWPELYGSGRQLNRYPWDAVVRFVHANRPPDRAAADVGVVEVGCGAGANLWFAAREGFAVAGIDGSESAIAYAQQRFDDDDLAGDLRVGDFTELPWPDGTFDLAIDRAALTCCGRTAAGRAVAELHRVLRPGGRLLFTPYSDRHPSAGAGRPGEDGVRSGIDAGALVGVGQICFYSRDDIDRLLDGWRLLAVEHHDVSDELDTAAAPLRGHWHVVAERA